MQADIRGRLATLRRAQNLVRKQRKKEQTRTSFQKDPFKFAKGLFTEEMSGTAKGRLGKIPGKILLR